MKLPGDFACLAVETSTEICTVAACRNGFVARREQPEGPDRSRAIYLQIRDVLDEVELRLPQLDCVAFGCGPGGFTGLRVGAAVAQSLAFGAGLPVCRVSSLATLAYGAARRSGREAVAACIDARMGEIYAGCYRYAKGKFAALEEDQLTSPDAWCLPGSEAFVAVGRGWLAYPALRKRLANRLLDGDPRAWPDAADLLVLAADAFARDETVVASDAVPNYLRDRVTG
ncbi:MAG: tRNA (adenosine(37)-N6)-threonylcarbamoyltransferase complex dimerization subunit type 1 TsaB [Gammaproteobacteria bacterium]|nr:tRNA (adenosine(37)-N6)-threonylcarbamoyltransferase complex dimerization subunit type 1 TsaB [Gammaproteobacteria bacterium]